MTENTNTNTDAELGKLDDPSTEGRDALKAVMTRQHAYVRLANGDELDVEIGNPDTIRWEQTAARRWPELLPDTDDKGNMRFKAPMFMQTFVAWAALKRCRLYDGDFETFSTVDALDITVDEVDVNPTPPARSAG